MFKNLVIGNLNISYRTWGAGEKTILILHGWGVDSSQYETMGAMLAEKGFCVIAPDLPGWGKSSAPIKVWDVDEYAEWVHKFVEAIHNPSLPPLTLRGGDQLEPPLKIRGGRGSYDNNFILFGHSFGGRIAIKYTTTYPKQPRALILCSAAGIKPTPNLKRRLASGLTFFGRILFTLPLLNKFAPFMREKLYSFAGTKDYLRAEGIMKKIIVKVLAEDLTPLLHNIHIPTLLLWGTLDIATPLKDGRLMAKLIPGAKLVIFENARHNLPKYIPEKLVTEIINFISSISSP